MAKAWMPFYIADYLADTGHLTAEQHGIYILSLFHYWQTEQPLTANAEQLQMICRCLDAAKFEQQWNVVSLLYVRDGETWRHSRMDKELLKASKLSETRAKAASARYQKKPAKAPANAVQLDTQSQSQSQSQSPKEEAEEPAAADGALKASIDKAINLAKKSLKNLSNEQIQIETTKWELMRDGKMKADITLDLYKWLERANAGGKSGGTAKNGVQLDAKGRVVASGTNGSTVPDL